MAFNVPDNAPPSPASDRSNERAPPAATKQAPKTEQPTSGSGSATKVSEETSKHDYSVGDLTDMFTTDDWLELYAYVDLIDNTKEDGRYAASWNSWAEAQGEQTPEQWRQYYEKVVRPQWLRDPQSKRDKIRKQIEQKHAEEEPSQSQSVRDQFPEPEKPEEEAVAPTPAARESKALEPPPAFDDERFEGLLNEEGSDTLPSAYIFYAREVKQVTLNAQPGLDHCE